METVENPRDDQADLSRERVLRYTSSSKVLIHEVFSTLETLCHGAGACGQDRLDDCHRWFHTEMGVSTVGREVTKAPMPNPAQVSYRHRQFQE